MEELLADPGVRSLVGELETITLARARRDGWWAWRRSESGWVFAIGATGHQPLGWRYYDGPERPQGGPLGAGWRTSDTGNWSGDWS
jgi:hypothetical protein